MPYYKYYSHPIPPFPSIPCVKRTSQFDHTKNPRGRLFSCHLLFSNLLAILVPAKIRLDLRCSHIHLLIQRIQRPGIGNGQEKLGAHGDSSGWSYWDLHTDVRLNYGILMVIELGFSFCGGFFGRDWCWGCPSGNSTMENGWTWLIPSVILPVRNCSTAALNHQRVQDGGPPRYKLAYKPWNNPH